MDHDRPGYHIYTMDTVAWEPGMGAGRAGLGCGTRWQELGLRVGLARSGCSIQRQGPRRGIGHATPQWAKQGHPLMHMRARSGG